MIQANELRIGNLISITGVQIKLDAAKLAFILERDGPITRCEGIPLTPERLKKCGFACLDGDCDLSISPSIYLKYDKDASTVHLWIDDYPFQYFDFLHELQNIYYWLKKEELEIN